VDNIVRKNAVHKISQPFCHVFLKNSFNNFDYATEESRHQAALAHDALLNAPNTVVCLLG